MTTPQAAFPTPERIFRTINAHQETAALRTGIDLDVFTAIAEGADEPVSLSQRTGASERGIRILCNSLTVLGFLTKRDGRYSLAPDAAFFLNRRSPASMCTLPRFLLRDEALVAFVRLTDAVKQGGTAMGFGDNEKPHEEMWVEFARSMAPITVPSATMIAHLTGMQEGKPCKVLDIAAGHGMFGILLAKANPNAHITAVDWPAVLEVARENAAAAGVADRFTARAGSAFDVDLGEGYDYALLTNIFHHFDQDTCVRLMQRVHAALKPGGQAVTLEFVTEEDGVSPPTPALFSLMMLAHTDRGEAFTFRQYDAMFAKAGFARTRMEVDPHLPEQVLISEK
jgi:ubiquinone/menaquinone biosynthesis C-methylase UbiE